MIINHVFMYATAAYIMKIKCYYFCRLYILYCLEMLISFYLYSINL